MLTKKQKFYLPFKRSIDVFGSLVGMIVLLPFFIVCAVMTKTSSKGPVLFKQERLGIHKVSFVLYKFRSMKVDARQVGQENLSAEEQNKFVTNWGRFMRKTSFDEIPQLWNILKGDMSFIGPRPGMAINSDDLIAARDSFTPSAFEVKPGLSGYAQIHMKRASDVEEKAREDSYYVEHFGFWLDFKLFVYSFFLAVGFVRGR